MELGYFLCAVRLFDLFVLVDIICGFSAVSLRTAAASCSRGLDCWKGAPCFLALPASARMQYLRRRRGHAGPGVRARAGAEGEKFFYQCQIV